MPSCSPNRLVSSVAGTIDRPRSVAIFEAGSSAVDARIAKAPARSPLILLSHGTGGSAGSLAWLGESLASNGFFAAAVNHHGNAAATDEPRLEETIVFGTGRAISDAGRIGVAGFSLGGYTALASVGAPVFGQAMTKESLSSIAVPVQLVVGSNDNATVPGAPTRSTGWKGLVARADSMLCRAKNNRRGRPFGETQS